MSSLLLDGEYLIVLQVFGHPPVEFDFVRPGVIGRRHGVAAGEVDTTFFLDLTAQGSLADALQSLAQQGQFRFFEPWSAVTRLE
ncbi:hypothetical protein D3C85_933000 [compost metagenome]